ncbi:MAG TPA: glutamate--tRNA ligase [Micropepsaceae bacterium]
MAENSVPVLRFAPSPTGYLHIGGARTALFNWLYARHSGGTFLLRIEDTDRERSTPEAVAAIFNGLSWMGLDWDGEPTFQFARVSRHREVAEQMLAKGQAYRCYATPQELEQMRAEQKAKGLSIRYDGRWRDRTPGPEQHNMPYVVRLKAPQTGETIVHDVVQGSVRWANDQLDDMVLLRSDGTPTYMLAVVVDDFDMGVTHVIRGVDHLNNAARQLQIIQAMGWPVPVYGHVPLIHGSDGAKLSKRHGALAVEAYRDMGYLPEAMRNYLLRLGWSHGDDEIIPTEKAIELFDLAGIGRSAARFDLKKLESINAHYMREMSDGALAGETLAFAQRIGPGRSFDAILRARLAAAMPFLKPRAKTLVELLEKGDFLFISGTPAIDKAAAAALTPETRGWLRRLALELEGADWNTSAIEACTRGFAEREGIKLGDIAQPLRAALTGRTASPPVFDVLAVLGREEALTRIRAQGD